MKYMLLMYANEAEGSKLTPEELKAVAAGLVRLYGRSSSRRGIG